MWRGTCNQSMPAKRSTTVLCIIKIVSQLMILCERTVGKILYFVQDRCHAIHSIGYTVASRPHYTKLLLRMGVVTLRVLWPSCTAKHRSTPQVSHGEDVPRLVQKPLLKLAVLKKPKPRSSAFADSGLFQSATSPKGTLAYSQC